MRCEFCQGSGLSVSPRLIVPCAECGGYGILQPCEGLRPQPPLEPRSVMSKFDMARMLDWAEKSNQRSATPMRSNRDGRHKPVATLRRTGPTTNYV
jgi:hypothetical protein